MIKQIGHAFVLVLIATANEMLVEIEWRGDENITLAANTIDSSSTSFGESHRLDADKPNR